MSKQSMPSPSGTDFVVLEVLRVRVRSGGTSKNSGIDYKALDFLQGIQLSHRLKVESDISKRIIAYAPTTGIKFFLKYRPNGGQTTKLDFRLLRVFENESKEVERGYIIFTDPPNKEGEITVEAIGYEMKDWKFTCHHTNSPISLDGPKEMEVKKEEQKKTERREEKQPTSPKPEGGKTKRSHKTAGLFQIDPERIKLIQT